MPTVLPAGQFPASFPLPALHFLRETLFHWVFSKEVFGVGRAKKQADANTLVPLLDDALLCYQRRSAGVRGFAAKLTGAQILCLLVQVFLHVILPHTFGHLLHI